MRKDSFKDLRKVVLKVGTTMIADDYGKPIPARFRSLAQDVAELHRKKIRVVLVSSGAIAHGIHFLNLKRRPHAIESLQACASVGQPHLMLHYEKAFRRHGLKVAQILLTRDDLSDRRRFLNAKHTLHELLSYDVIPIINENDTVMVEEIKFGDNDNLAALVTNVFDADLLWILTDSSGLFTADPKKDPQARHIPLVENIDKATFDLASGTNRITSVGGMATKVQAAKTAAEYGVPTIISSGHDRNKVGKLLSGTLTHTFFMPSQKKLEARKHWIVYTLKAAGQLIVDAGAKKALTEDQKSLLPKGIMQVKGDFGVGEAVDIVDLEGQAFARGLVSYAASELQKIIGKKSSEIEGVLGYKYADEVIHRDDLAFLR